MPSVSTLITIGQLRPEGAPHLAEYAKGVIPLIQAAGGTVMIRLRPTETVVGSAETQPDLVAIMNFPSADAIKAFLGSEAYQREVPHRDNAFAVIHSYIAEEIKP